MIDDGKELIFKIEINNFSEYVKKANKARPIPYIKGKCRLPKKYDTDEFEWRKYKYFGKNIEARFAKGSKDFLIANSKTANKPRFVKVNGQEVYNQMGGSFNRAFMRNQLHSFYDEYLKDIPKIENIDKFPLTVWLKFYLHDMGKSNIDNDNKWPWRKWLQDSMVENGIIIDDNINFINDNRETTYIIPETEEQKLIIEVYG